MSAHKTPVRAAANAKGDIPAGAASDTWTTRTVGTDGQTLVGDSTQKSGLGWKNRSRAIANASSDVAAANTTVETTLATLALPTDLAAGDVLRLKAVIEQLNSSGSAATFQYKIKLGATTIFDSTAQSANSSGSARYALANADILVVATNDQRSSWTLTIGSGTANSAQGVGTNIAARGTSATEDLTAGKNLVITVTMGTAAASITTTLHEAMLTVVRA